MAMSDERKLLLLKGAKNNGVVTVQMARRLYSSNKQARSALTSLDFKGYLEKTGTPGAFKIVKLPKSVKEQFERWQDEQEQQEVEVG